MFNGVLVLSILLLQHSLKWVHLYIASLVYAEISWIAMFSCLYCRAEGLAWSEDAYWWSPASNMPTNDLHLLVFKPLSKPFPHWIRAAYETMTIRTKAHVHFSTGLLYCSLCRKPAATSSGQSGCLIESPTLRETGPWPVASTNLPVTWVSHFGCDSYSPSLQVQPQLTVDYNFMRDSEPEPPAELFPNSQPTEMVRNSKWLLLF